jgi:hypothetical protein
MRAGLAVALAVAIGAVAPAGAAAGQPPPARYDRCHVGKGAEVLRAGSQAVVVRRPSRSHPRERVVKGCLRAVGEWLTVGEGGGRVDLVRTAGTKVAIVHPSPSFGGHADLAYRYLGVKDLRTDTILDELYFDHGEDSDDGGDDYPYARVTDLVLGATGRIAFIWRGTGGTYTVTRRTRNLVSELDAGRSISARSLTRRGDDVCWLRQRRARCAAFADAR